MSKGLFITLEGPEGSGKSSAIKIVVEKLKALGYEIVMTREPGGTPISEQIRNVILDNNNTEEDPRTEALLYAASRRQHLVEKIWPAINEGEQIRNVILDNNNTEEDPRTEALLYAASRRQHLVEKIWPAINEGKIVICDRYLDSSLAYQGHARGLGIDNILKVNEYATEGTFPDLTLLFDIEPEIGFERINKNKDREVNRLDKEALSFHHKVREGYLLLSKRFSDRYEVIDASKDLDTVVNNVYNVILKRLGK